MHHDNLLAKHVRLMHHLLRMRDRLMLNPTLQSDDDEDAASSACVSPTSSARISSSSGASSARSLESLGSLESLESLDSLEKLENVGGHAYKCPEYVDVHMDSLARQLPTPRFEEKKSAPTTLATATGVSIDVNDVTVDDMFAGRVRMLVEEIHAHCFSSSKQAPYEMETLLSMVLAHNGAQPRRSRRRCLTAIARRTITRVVIDEFGAAGLLRLVGKGRMSHANLKDAVNVAVAVWTGLPGQAP